MEASSVHIHNGLLHLQAITKDMYVEFIVM